MKKDIRQAVGSPDSSVFIRRCVIYGIILAVMLLAAPSIFSKIMVPMAAKGIKTAWFCVYIPIAAVLMAIDLFRCWRRRWPLAYLNNYRRMSRDNGYEICPRCGAEFELRTRHTSYTAKVGEKITTTTYSDGSKSTRTEDITERRTAIEHYYACSNSDCGLEPDKRYSQSHLPWKISEIRCLAASEHRHSGRACKPAKQLVLSRLLFPILSLLMIVACAISIYSYANAHDGEWTYTTADKESGRSAEEYQSYLLSLDTENPGWHVTYEKSPTDMMNYLGSIFGKDIEAGYTLGCYTFEGGIALEFRFEGNDAGTGIPDGQYILTELNGINVLIDDINETIYKEGTEVYDTYAPKLKELSHDIALSSVLESVKGGEHALSGTNDFWMEFIRKDDSMVYSYMLSDDVTKISGREFRAVTLNPDEQTMERWFFSYDESEYNPVEDLDGYVYSDAAFINADDELGKLMEKSFDDSGSVAFYKDGEAVLGIYVEYFPDGYAFEIKLAADDYGKGLEEDMVYRVNTAENTLTKIENYDYSDEIKTDMPLSDHQDTYDFLMSIVPHTYIRSIIDMDKADVRKEKLGLITVYEMKDEDGNVTADLKKMFGLIGEVIHYTSEDEYVMIELEH
ncbi:MAG: hypothetical protein IJD22_01345 [Clostridia bacterium]|nr:hypothetical protein [Clostridia bacterium]